MKEFLPSLYPQKCFAPHHHDHSLMALMPSCPKNATVTLHSFNTNSERDSTRVTDGSAQQLSTWSSFSSLLFHSLCSLHHVTHTWFHEMCEMRLCSASLSVSGQAVVVKAPAACSRMRVTFSINWFTISQRFPRNKSALQFLHFPLHCRILTTPQTTNVPQIL